MGYENIESGDLILYMDLLDGWSMFSHGTSHGVNALRINPHNTSGHTQCTNCIYISSQFIFKSRKAWTELHTSFMACKSAIYVAGHFLNCYVNPFIVMNHILEFRLLIIVNLHAVIWVVPKTVKVQHFFNFFLVS